MRLSLAMCKLDVFHWNTELAFILALLLSFLVALWLYPPCWFFYVTFPHFHCHQILPRFYCSRFICLQKQKETLTYTQMAKALQPQQCYDVINQLLFCSNTPLPSVPRVASAVNWSRGPRPWHRFTHGPPNTATCPIRVLWPRIQWLYGTFPQIYCH